MFSSVGIVGFGAFGRFMGSHLSARLPEVIAFDPSGVDAISIGGPVARVRAGGLDDVARCDALVLAVPLSAMQPVLHDLSVLLRENQSARLVADVCSVKVEPIRLMRELLPERVQILGTHPLFGPQSGARGIAGLSIALCPVRIEPDPLAWVRAELAGGLGLRVVEVEPQRHDREMAFVQGLTHYLSRALAEMPLPETELSTVAYERLLSMRSNLAADSWALFETIQNGNAHAVEVRAALRRGLDAIESRLNDPTPR